MHLHRRAARAALLVSFLVALPALAAPGDALFAPVAVGGGTSAVEALAAADGSFVTVLATPVAGGYVVDAQPWTATGVPQRAPFRLIPATVPYQSRAVALDATGALLAAWTTPAGAVMARRVSRNGAALTPVVQVTPSGACGAPAIGGGSSGQFVVAWSCSKAEYRVFRASGAALTPRLPLASDPPAPVGGAGHDTNLRLVADPAGSFAVYWERRWYDPPYGAQNLLVRSFNAQGLPFGTETLIAGLPEIAAWQQAMDRGTGGRYVAAWRYSSDFAIVPLDRLGRTGGSINYDDYGDHRLCMDAANRTAVSTLAGGAVTVQAFTWEGALTGASLALPLPGGADTAVSALDCDAAGNLLFTFQRVAGGATEQWVQRFAHP